MTHFHCRTFYVSYSHVMDWGATIIHKVKFLVPFRCGKENDLDACFKTFKFFVFEEPMSRIDDLEQYRPLWIVIYDAPNRTSQANMYIFFCWNRFSSMVCQDVCSFYLYKFQLSEIRNFKSIYQLFELK